MIALGAIVTSEHSLQLASAAIGFVGTVVMFVGSYSLQPMEGAAWGGPETNANNAKIRARNQRRTFLQRVGIGLLTASFLTQIIALSGTKPPEVKAAQVAPACVNGAADCKPWERDWQGEGPQVGAVVTKDGRIVSDTTSGEG